MKFLSTLSLRRATFELLPEFFPVSNFYPRSPCGERHTCVMADLVSCEFLSTLSLRRATPFFVRHILGVCISIHALLAESDCITTTIICTAWRFLSTLSLRRATITKTTSLALYIYFYPRSPCGERLEWAGAATDYSDFYPRSPCGERRPLPCWMPPSSIFLSTLSLRRATRISLDGIGVTLISIHALLAESDLFN